MSIGTAIKRLLRTEPGERIDHPDLKHAAFRSVVDAFAQLGTDFILGDDRAGTGLIIKGFRPVGSNSPPTVTIARGAAILGNRFDGQLRYGLLASGGDSSKSFDLTSLSDGTYDIYIRAEFRETGFANRRFWDAVGDVEVVRNIATRWSEDWSVMLELQTVSPGPEWVKVGEIVKAGANATVTDTRNLFFEGRFDNGFALDDDDWGSTDDRDSTAATRASTNGVFGLWRSLTAIRRQLQDIIGGSFWFSSATSGTASGTTTADGSTSTGPRTLTQLNAEKFARNGAMDFTGNLLSDNNTRNIGASSDRWNKLWANAADVTLVEGTSSNFSGASTASYFQPSTTIGSGTPTNLDRVVTDNIIRAWCIAEVNPAGTLHFIKGYNVSSTLWDAGGGSFDLVNGVIEFTYLTPLASANYAAVVQCLKGPVPDAFAVVGSRTSAGLVVSIQHAAGGVFDLSGTGANLAFMLIVVGG